MKTNTPHKYRRRYRTEHEKLYAAGWRVWFRDERGVFLKHPKVPGHTFLVHAATTVQRAWDAKRRAEGG